jgi:hypothetical protein
MKKTMLIVGAALALAVTVKAQTITAQTNFSESNVATANVAAAEATLTSETNIPSGTTLASFSRFKNPTTGNWTLMASYR